MNSNQNEGISNQTIGICNHCGGLYIKEGNGYFAGTPCLCVRNAVTTPQPQALQEPVEKTPDHVRGITKMVEEESFQEWYASQDHINVSNESVEKYYFSKKAWDHQKQKIDQLEEQLKASEERVGELEYRLHRAGIAGADALCKVDDLELKIQQIQAECDSYRRGLYYISRVISGQFEGSDEYMGLNSISKIDKLCKEYLKDSSTIPTVKGSREDGK